MPVYNEPATVERRSTTPSTPSFRSRRGARHRRRRLDRRHARDSSARRDWPENVTVVQHDRNRGKGAAVRTALAHATGDFAAILDADLEYGATDSRLSSRRYSTGEARVVYGTRSCSSHSAFSFWYVIGNKAVTQATNVLFNCWISDVMTCHKVMPTELFRSLELRERGFAIEPEITARVLRAGERIYEVPITYQARSREEGKKLTAADGVRVLLTLLRCRVS